MDSGKRAMLYYACGDCHKRGDVHSEVDTGTFSRHVSLCDICGADGYSIYAATLRFGRQFALRNTVRVVSYDKRHTDRGFASPKNQDVIFCTIHAKKQKSGERKTLRLNLLNLFRAHIVIKHVFISFGFVFPIVVTFVGGVAVAQRSKLLFIVDLTSLFNAHTWKGVHFLLLYTPMF